MHVDQVQNFVPVGFQCVLDQALQHFHHLLPVAAHPYQLVRQSQPKLHALRHVHPVHALPKKLRQLQTAQHRLFLLHGFAHRGQPPVDVVVALHDKAHVLLQLRLDLHLQQLQLRLLGKQFIFQVVAEDPGHHLHGGDLAAENTVVPGIAGIFQDHPRRSEEKQSHQQERQRPGINIEGGGLVNGQGFKADIVRYPGHPQRLHRQPAEQINIQEGQTAEKQRHQRRARPQGSGSAEKRADQKPGGEQDPSDGKPPQQPHQPAVKAPEEAHVVKDSDPFHVEPAEKLGIQKHDLHQPYRADQPAQKPGHPLRQQRRKRHREHHRADDKTGVGEIQEPQQRLLAHWQPHQPQKRLTVDAEKGIHRVIGVIILGNINDGNKNDPQKAQANAHQHGRQRKRASAGGNGLILSHSFSPFYCRRRRLRCRAFFFYFLVCFLLFILQ